MWQTHLTFGKEFSEAIEKKQVAQQEAERSKFVVMKVRTAVDDPTRTIGVISHTAIATG